MARKISKELNFENSDFSNIFPTWCCRLLIFQTINLVISKNLSLKYQRFILAGCKDTSFRKIEFVTKTLFSASDTRLWLVELCTLFRIQYKIRLVSRLIKREDKALISISTILKFPELGTFEWWISGLMLYLFLNLGIK